MGKGGKNDQQQQKRRKQQEEEQDDDEDIEEIEDDEDLDDDEEDSEEIDYFDAELSDREAELLDKINEEILSVDEPLKLTWAAIHKLKQEQKALNEKMDEQMRKIQEKFQVLKNPLIQKIAKVASGHKFEKQLYTQHELTKSISANKHKPQAIPGFWKKSLDSVGFVHGQEDATILDNCTGFQCSIDRKKDAENNEQTIKIHFHFDENPIIHNKELKLTVQKKNEEYTKLEQTPIKFKGDTPQENCAFAEIFNPEVEAQELYSISCDLERAYNNSVFYYFYEGQIDNGENPQAIENQEGEEEDDSDSEQEVKPVKKKGTKGKQEQKKPLEKPECKQQ